MDGRSIVQIAVLVVAAVFEVAGDALIRRGLRGGGLAFVAIGFAVLGSYGVLVTMLQLDFSKVMGVYVGLFTLASMLFGWLVFGERISLTTWIGVGIVLSGSLVIQLGGKTAPSQDAPELRANDTPGTNL